MTKIIKNRPGYVYLVKLDDKYFKIGKTKNLKQRLEGLSAHKRKTELIHTIESNDCVQLEKYYHDMFSHKQIDGELFDLDESDIQTLSLEKTFYYEDNDKDSECELPDSGGYSEQEYIEGLTRSFYHFIFNLAFDESKALMEKFPNLSEDEINFLLNRSFNIANIVTDANLHQGLQIDVDWNDLISKHES